MHRAVRRALDGRRRQDLAGRRAHGDQDSALPTGGVHALQKKALGFELESAIQGEHECPSVAGRLDRVLAAGDRRTPHAHLHDLLPIGPGQEAVVDQFHSADPVGVDVRSTQDRQCGVLTGSDPHPLFLDVDAGDVESERGGGDLVADLAAQVNEAPVTGEASLQDPAVGSQHLRQSSGRPCRVLHTPRVGDHRLPGHRQDEVDAVSIHDRPACGPQLHGPDALGLAMGHEPVGFQELQPGEAPSEQPGDQRECQTADDCPAAEALLGLPIWHRCGLATTEGRGPVGLPTHR